MSHLEVCVKKYPQHSERFAILKKDYVFSEVHQKSWVPNTKQDSIGTFQRDTITNFFPAASGVLGKTSTATKITVAGANYALATMIIDAQLPFSITEHPAFKAYINTVFMLGKSQTILQYSPSSRRSVEAEIFKVCSDTIQEFMTNGKILSCFRYHHTDTEF